MTLTGPGRDRQDPAEPPGRRRTGRRVRATASIFVELAPITDPAWSRSTIAQALGVRDVGGRPSLDAIVKPSCASRRLLLLLDNFEQILRSRNRRRRPAGGVPRAQGAGDQPRAAPDCAASDEYPVPPLATARRRRPVAAPDRSRSTPPSPSSSSGRSPIRPDFALTNANAPVVAEICRPAGRPAAGDRAGGGPDPAALAAGAARPAGPRPRRCSTGGARDLPARQQTLRDAIAWSYDLLDEPRAGAVPAPRRLRRRLHAGGRRGRLRRRTIATLDMLDGLESLVYKSLVQQTERPDGEPRFAMLETIREYALERLTESGEAEPIRRRHADHFLTAGRAGRAAPAASGRRSLAGPYCSASTTTCERR